MVSGTITLTYASRDSLDGTVAVPGIEAVFDFSGKPHGAYEFFLIPGEGLLIDNRVIWDGSQFGVTCTFIDVNGGRISHPATCSLGPAGGA